MNINMNVDGIKNKLSTNNSTAVKSAIISNFITNENTWRSMLWQRITEKYTA